MKVAIIRFTENTGRTYIVDITNDVDKWLEDNNSMRDEPEKLSDFDIEWTTIKTYESDSRECKPKKHWDGLNKKLIDGYWYVKLADLKLA